MHLDTLIDYEQGTLDEADVIRLFATLIESGMAWSLQGHYGRTARDLIDAGTISPHGEILVDLDD